jgi:alpha-beta hydrolase superfamily lysophospholipase
MIRRKYKRGILGLIILGIISINIIAFIHAYTFTHFTDEPVSRTKDPLDLSLSEKIKILIAGIDNPRPHNLAEPTQRFENFDVNSSGRVACWKVPTDSSKGTVILFHGYAGEKSSLISRSDEFIRQGYSTILVDFLGSGGSEGNATTVGFKEAAQVKDVFDHVTAAGESNIILFGTSMGAVAVLKAIDDSGIQPAAVVLECPFGSLYATVCARFEIMGVPCSPMAGALTFWGGVKHGYWGFSHNAYDYAPAVKCPVLLMAGDEDNRVSVQQTQEIFSNLAGPKVLKIYPSVGHNVFAVGNQSVWVRDVSEFLASLEK